MTNVICTHRESDSDVKERKTNGEFKRLKSELTILQSAITHHVIAIDASRRLRPNRKLKFKRRFCLAEPHATLGNSER